MQTSTDYGKRKMNLISTMLRIFIIVAIIMPCECCVCGSDCGRTAIMYSNHVKSLPDQRSVAIQQFSIIAFFHFIHNFTFTLHLPFLYHSFSLPLNFSFSLHVGFSSLLHIQQLLYSLTELLCTIAL